MGRRRALFYSDDTVGLGHLQKTLLLCAGLGERFEDLSTLIITGSPMAHVPRGADYLKLPSVSELDDEVRESRSPGTPLEGTLALREQIIFHTVTHCRPNWLFVDNVPLGVGGELAKTLDHAKRYMSETRIFLGLRDTLDDGREILPRWQRLGVMDALERFYDGIFIYGLPLVFDPIREYQWPERIRRKVSFCGYIPRPVDKEASREARSHLCANGEKLVLVAADGVRLIESYLEALPDLIRHSPVKSVVLPGPAMTREGVRRFSGRRDPGVTFLDSCEDPLIYLDAADLVVSTGGYDTISEVLALGKKAIAVPRTEQVTRSQRLQDLGLLRMIHPDEVSPGRMAAEIIAALQSETAVPEASLEFTPIEKVASQMGWFLRNGSPPQGVHPR